MIASRRKTLYGWLALLCLLVVLIGLAVIAYELVAYFTQPFVENPCSIARDCPRLY